MNLEHVVKHLNEIGFRKVAIEGPYIVKMISDDRAIRVTIEEDSTELTSEQEEIIKKRLRELGYLD